MSGNCLLYGLGISGISTGLYVVLTHEKGNETIDRKAEYSTIFCVIMIVSIIVLYITSGDNQSVIPLKGGSKTNSLNNTPPF